MNLAAVPRILHNFQLPQYSCPVWAVLQYGVAAPSSSFCTRKSAGGRCSLAAVCSGDSWLFVMYAQRSVALSGGRPSSRHPDRAGPQYAHCQVVGLAAGIRTEPVRSMQWRPLALRYVRTTQCSTVSRSAVCSGDSWLFVMYAQRSVALSGGRPSSRHVRTEPHCQVVGLAAGMSGPSRSAVCSGDSWLFVMYAQRSVALRSAVCSGDSWLFVMYAQSSVALSGGRPSSRHVRTEPVCSMHVALSGGRPSSRHVRTEPVCSMQWRAPALRYKSGPSGGPSIKQYLSHWSKHKYLPLHPFTELITG
ncbi:hypothetical protein J6590_034212 [Homalodisca vitripennis]|nr:hypothetical protein J6590_034212 [Homalodisca vitripennis]